MALPGFQIKAGIGPENGILFFAIESQIHADSYR
jgi:hypothetical protein